MASLSYTGETKSAVDPEDLDPSWNTALALKAERQQIEELKKRDSFLSLSHCKAILRLEKGTVGKVRSKMMFACEKESVKSKEEVGNRGDENPAERESKEVGELKTGGAGRE